MQQEPEPGVGVLRDPQRDVHLHRPPAHDPDLLLPLLRPAAVEVLDQAGEALGIRIGGGLRLDLKPKSRDQPERLVSSVRGGTSMTVPIIPILTPPI